jgi:hypothetical protein
MNKTAKNIPAMLQDITAASPNMEKGILQLVILLSVLESSGSSK